MMKRCRSTRRVRKSVVHLPLRDLLALAGLTPPEQANTVVQVNAWAVGKASADYEQHVVSLYIEYDDETHSSTEEFNAESKA